MDSLQALAAGGLRVRTTALDLLANNLANAGSAGFKPERERCTAVRVNGEATDDQPEPFQMIDSADHWTDFAQGSFTETGNDAHLALSGPGFFVVDDARGPLLTRNGQFTVDGTGVLRDAAGRKVRTADNRPYTLDRTLPFSVSPDGVVTQRGAEVTRVQIAAAERTDLLERVGESYFRATGQQLGTAAGVRVQQGKLEAAAVAPAEQAVRLVQVLRQAEMLNRAVALGSEMNRRATEEVARVNS